MKPVRALRDGLLVLIDRKSRRYIIEKLAHVTQDDVVAALKRMIARKAIGKVLSITTDNGCEFLDPEKIKAVVGCREPTSASSRARTCTGSSASSTLSTAGCSAARPPASSTPPSQRRHEEERQ